MPGVKIMTGQEVGPRTDPAPFEVILTIELKAAALRISPHDTGRELDKSVCTVTESLAALAPPSVQPTRVIVVI